MNRAAPSQETYQQGDSVSHRVFGNGMVLSVTPMGNDSLLEIAFEKVGTKKLMANFARLKRGAPAGKPRENGI